jgi:hypothetical protein
MEFLSNAHFKNDFVFVINDRNSICFLYYNKVSLKHSLDRNTPVFFSFLLHKILLKVSLERSLDAIPVINDKDEIIFKMCIRKKLDFS